jgi:hypothetical protein
MMTRCFVDNEGKENGNMKNKIARSRAFIAAVAAFAVIATLSFVVQAASAEEGKKLPVMTNNTGKVLLQRLSQDKKWNSEIFIQSISGVKITMDAYQTPDAVIEALSPDIILSTHRHSEHIDPKLVARFENNPGTRISVGKAEQFTFKGISVTSFAASHSLAKPVNEQNPDDFIYVIEVDGLRIANFGGIGQKEFTQAQLASLGRIDVALLPFFTYGTSMSPAASVALVKQLNPAVVIITHLSDDVVMADMEKALGRKLEIIPNSLALSVAELKAGSPRFIKLTNELY